MFWLLWLSIFGVDFSNPLRKKLKTNGYKETEETLVKRSFNFPWDGAIRIVVEHARIV